MNWRKLLSVYYHYHAMSQSTKIVNTTQGTILCATCEMADNPIKKTKGLMFRESLPEGHGMLFSFSRSTSAGMWMFGMRFAIDMIFLDSEKRVIHLVENVRPLGFSWRTWRIYSSPVPASFVLELPSGAIAKTTTKAGDSLDF